MTMGLTIQDEETPVVPDTASFWNQVAFLVGHFDPDRNGLVEVLCRDVASRSRPAQITFYHRSPIEVLQIVLDRPLHDHELADAVELLQQSTMAPTSSADGTLDTES